VRHVQISTRQVPRHYDEGDWVRLDGTSAAPGSNLGYTDPGWLAKIASTARDYVAGFGEVQKEMVHRPR